MEEANQCETETEDALGVSSYGGGTLLGPALMTARKLTEVLVYLHSRLNISYTALRFDWRAVAD